MELIIGMAWVYLGVGLIFAVFFALKGAASLDPVAKGAPFGFRLLLLPGSIALWPLLWLKLLRKNEAVT